MAKTKEKKIVEADSKALRLPALLAAICGRKKAAVSKRENAFEDRNAFQDKLHELGLEAKAARTDEYLKTCADLTEILDQIKTLDTVIKSCVTAYDKVAEDCEQGTLAFAELTVDELLDAAGKKGGGQMSLAEIAAAGEEPGPDAPWKTIHAFRPAFWNDREWPLVATHASHLEALADGSVPCDNPLALSSYMLAQFKAIKGEDATAQRSSILPKVPDWFTMGLRAVLTAAVKGELGEPGDEGHETDALSIKNRLAKCAEIDVHAWLALCGGPDSDLNKAVLAV